MTIAIDRKTGVVVGQLCREMPWTNRDKPTSEHVALFLTRDGYKTLRLNSVRLERTGN